MFACDWCGTPIDHYAAHFANPIYAGCREAARRPEPKLEVLDGGLAPNAARERDQIRRQAKRNLARSRRRDREEQLMQSSVRFRDRHHEQRLESKRT